MDGSRQGSSSFYYGLMKIIIFEKIKFETTFKEILCLTSFYVALSSFFACKVDDVIGATYMATMWTGIFFTVRLTQK